MDQFPFGYERIHESSWAYLSSLLMLALFFKFNRFWSIRNADLFLLILIAPGILLVSYRSAQTTSASRPVTTAPETVIQQPESLPPQNPSTAENETASGDPSTAAGTDSGIASARPVPENRVDSQEPVPISALSRTDLINRAGYIWLFGCGGLLLLRVLLDPLLIRRPLLDPNLSIGGLVFLGCSLMTFIFADIINSRPQPGSLDGAIGAMKMVQREAAGDEARQELMYHGPGYALIHVVPSIPTFTSINRQAAAAGDSSRQPLQLEITAKILVITSHIAMVFGLIAIGYYHFSNFRTGVGIAVIWLMMPYTIMYSGNAYHVLPAALIVWAVALYRHPLVAGVMLGLATGVTYYPLFLLPLWLSFYWETRVSNFLTGFLVAIGVCVGGLIFTSQDVWHFFVQLQAMFGFWLPRVDRDLLQGIWVLGWDPWFRLPLLVAFVILSISFVFWPATKNLGTLIAYTAAIMIAVQFWHGYQGGTFVAWYLPLLLATIFRPNLSDRVAATQIPSHLRRLRVDPTQRVSPAA